MVSRVAGALVLTMGNMFGGVQNMMPMIKPLLAVFVQEVAGSLTENFELSQVCHETRVCLLRLEYECLLTRCNSL
jgi:hypothetical protein